MDNTNNSTKNDLHKLGESVKLFIGNISFDAIRLIDSKEYRMSQSQVLKAINRNKNYLSRLQSDTPEKAQKLTQKGFTWVTLGTKYHDGRQSRFAETLSLDDAFVLWRFEDKRGNEVAELLVDALGNDSLRDRFDQVYGKERTSVEER